VDIPGLKAVSVTWHRAPDPRDIDDLARFLRAHPDLRELAIRPASVAVLDALAELAPALDVLEVASIWPEGVERLVAHAAVLRPRRRLEVRVLDLERPARIRLRLRLMAVFGEVVVKGASYRADGGY
ncbi:MAG: hypothetical protein KC656_22960, partial [Myxococcales bacterium]|nr:hypothetical protein [Myxococcales bacterium]